MAINLTFNLFMNTMNKLYKCALGLLTTFILSFACFSSADNVATLINSYDISETSISTSWNTVVDLGTTEYTVCMQFNGWIDVQYSNIQVGFSSSMNSQPPNYLTYYNSWRGNYICIYKGLSDRYVNIRHTNQSTSLYGDYFILDNLLSTTIPVYTSLECQTEYNLIPISEVTPNYCALNFGMINPQECPINSGTGAIVRSNLMINDVPYAQNQNINVFIPDFLAWNISFNDLYTVIDVEGYNADESYIENVINQEKLTPTNKDFEEMLTGFMTNYFPYLALAIVFLYLARKIFKLFK